MEADPHSRPLQTRLSPTGPGWCRASGGQRFPRPVGGPNGGVQPLGPARAPAAIATGGNAVASHAAMQQQQLYCVPGRCLSVSSRRRQPSPGRQKVRHKEGTKQG